ncbi:outer membrane beta-barrel protein [Pseudoduganella violaceinigra]|uniref:outer membrane beta-barrel protein n=1 Tax=Pseudoduganella violaceinigra TaxID=246602 RepID=UPI0004115A55|nr:outer membrane beta-barrel protein [Pseudoduganella violaceinigra]
MPKILTLCLITAATLAPFTAYAEDFYVGADIAPGGNLTFTNPVNGKSAKSDGKTALKLYSGFAITDYLAIEGGFSQSGTTTFDKAALGLTQSPTFKMRSLYLAGRFTHKFNDDWSVFAKAGFARTRFTAFNGVSERDSLSSTKPLLGLGVAYNVSKAVALTLELEHIGRTRKSGLDVKQDALHLGVKVGF